jgi:hypothetical protein
VLGEFRRTLDSRILDDDALATQDAVTQLISAIRKVRAPAPEAVLVPLDVVNDEVGKPITEWSDTVFGAATSRRLHAAVVRTQARNTLSQH